MRKRIDASVCVPDTELRWNLIRELRYFGVNPIEANGLIIFTYYGDPATIEDLTELVQSFGDFSLHTKAED